MEGGDGGRRLCAETEAGSAAGGVSPWARWLHCSRSHSNGNRLIHPARGRWEARIAEAEAAARVAEQAGRSRAAELVAAALEQAWLSAVLEEKNLAFAAQAETGFAAEALLERLQGRCAELETAVGAAEEAAAAAAAAAAVPAPAALAAAAERDGDSEEMKALRDRCAELEDGALEDAALAGAAAAAEALVETLQVRHGS